jgi:hypothetical protein
MRQRPRIPECDRLWAHPHRRRPRREGSLLRHIHGEVRHWRDRLKGFYPRLDDVTVYAIAVERVTGKHCPLPPVSEQWPALDRTKSPNARRDE